MPPQQEQLDPTVVALTRAIGQAESGGNYNAPRMDGGLSQGAYQMTPGFIQGYAKKYLDPGYDPNNLTPEQQDKLAYGVVKEWGTTGDPAYPHIGPLSPAQIASAWNTGSPNHIHDYEYGKNNHYGSTGAYIDKVGEFYNQNNQQSGIQQSQSTQQPISQQEQQPESNVSKWLWGLGGLALGAFSKIGEALSPTPEKIAGATTGALTGEAASFAVPGIGTIAGPVAGAAIGYLQGGQKAQTPTGQQVAQNLQQQNPDLALLEAELAQPVQNSNRLSQSIIESLQGTIGGRKLIQDPIAMAGVEAMRQYGLAPDITSNGSMDYNSGFKKSHSMIGKLSDSVSQVLEKEGISAPMQEVIENAKASIDRNKTMVPMEREQAKAHIAEIGGSYLRQSGDNKGNIGLHYLQTAKQQTGMRPKWDPKETTAQKEAYKAFSRGARQTIQSHTRHKSFYDAVMKVEQRLIRAQDIMKHLNGKKAPRHEGLLKSLMRHAGTSTGIYIGDKIGGPIGAILGSMVGGHILRHADKRFGATIFDTPAMKHALTLLHKENPRVFSVVQKEIEIAKRQEKKKEKPQQRLRGEAPPIEPLKGLYQKLAASKIQPQKNHKKGNKQPQRTNRK